MALPTSQDILKKVGVSPQSRLPSSKEILSKVEGRPFSTNLKSDVQKGIDEIIKPGLKKVGEFAVDQSSLLNPKKNLNVRVTPSDFLEGVKDTVVGIGKGVRAVAQGINEGVAVFTKSASERVYGRETLDKFANTPAGKILAKLERDATGRETPVKTFQQFYKTAEKYAYDNNASDDEAKVFAGLGVLGYAWAENPLFGPGKKAVVQETIDGLAKSTTRKESVDILKAQFPNAKPDQLEALSAITLPLKTNEEVSAVFQQLADASERFSKGSLPTSEQILQNIKARPVAANTPEVSTKLAETTPQSDLFSKEPEMVDGSVQKTPAIDPKKYKTVDELILAIEKENPSTVPGQAKAYDKNVVTFTNLAPKEFRQRFQKELEKLDSSADVGEKLSDFLVKATDFYNDTVLKHSKSSSRVAEIQSPLPSPTPPPPKKAEIEAPTPSPEGKGRPPRINTKLEKMAQESRDLGDFVRRSGITEAALDKTVKTKGYKDIDDYFSKVKVANDSDEIAYLERMAAQVTDSKDIDLLEDTYTRQFSPRAEEVKRSLDNAARQKAEDELDALALERDFIREAVSNNPAKDLTKYRGRKGNEKDVLPEVTGKPQVPEGAKETLAQKFARQGDDIVTELGFEDTETARKAYESYLKQRARLKEIETKIKESTTEYRDRKAVLKMLEEKVAADAASRRKSIQSVQDFFNLTDSEVATVIKQVKMKDIRLLSDSEFKNFMEKLREKALDNYERGKLRLQIRATIFEKELKNVENMRELMQLPVLQDMNQEQLQRYGKILDSFEKGDEFLSKRTLEVIDRTNLKGARTMRQVREYLANEMERISGKKLSPSDFGVLTADFTDKLKFDTELAQKSPFYNFMTRRVQTHLLAGELNYVRIQDKVNKLAKAARDSRPRSIGQRIKQLFIPQNREIIRYLEARAGEKEMYAKALTPEELKYAEFMRNYYNTAYNYLVYINELHGSRYKDAYFTHMRKGFLEKTYDEGLVAGLKSIRDAYKEDQIITNIIDADTGKILPKSKFFQFALKRTGVGEVSQNATHVFLSYAKMMERKKMLDKMVPELDVYASALTPKNLTPRGLEMDRSFKTFMNEYLNNKRGRKFSLGGLIPQNSIPDTFMRVGNLVVTLLDLGFSPIGSAATFIGEQIATFQALGALKYGLGYKRRLWDTGLKRLTTPGAASILKEAEPFIGRNVWHEMAEIDKPVLGKAFNAAMAGFAQSTVEANKIYLLASLTDKELKLGKISPERMAELRIEAGRWRDMGKDVKSIFGSTSIGETLTKYKAWALPILHTNIRNLSRLGKKVAAGDVKDIHKTQEFKETMRAVQLIATVMVVGSLVNATSEEEGFVNKLKSRAYQEALSLLGGMDPMTLLSRARLAAFIGDLGENISLIIKGEEYKEDGKYGEAGDLKGWGGLKSMLTPAPWRQIGDSDKTPEEIKADLLKDIESGKITVSAAKERYTKEMKSVEEKRRNKLFSLNQTDYKADLLKRIESKEITVAEGKKEFQDYLEAQKKEQPEAFEAPSESSFIEKVKVYAEAVGTDPVTAFNRIFTGQIIRRTDNGAIIVERLSKDESQRIKQERGGKNESFKLDHTIPLQLGGSNSESNLVLVPTEDWESYTEVENYLGKRLRDGEISKKDAQQMIQDLKAGKTTFEEIKKKAP